LALLPSTYSYFQWPIIDLLVVPIEGG
jgi:hypothetical protein